MSRTFIAIMAASCACFTAACSPHDPQTAQPQVASRPQAASSMVLNSPLGTLVKDRDRAKAVQNIVDSQAAKQSSVIDAQSHQ